MLYANAGHPEPLPLHRLRGELESISSNGREFSDDVSLAGMDVRRRCDD